MFESKGFGVKFQARSTVSYLRWGDVRWQFIPISFIHSHSTRLSTL